jgi:hypothetical protein
VEKHDSPSGAHIPELALNSDGTVKGGMETLVKALLAENDGLFFGDTDGVLNLSDTFADLLPTLKRSGVNTLYFEFVKSDHQSILDKFQKDGDENALKDYLKKNGWSDGKVSTEKWINHLVRMLAEARKNGIVLRGIGIDIHPMDTHTARANPHWANVVNENQSQNPGKYVVFGGRVHSAHYFHNTGVNALLHIPSITPYTKADALSDQKMLGFETRDAKIPQGAVAPNPYDSYKSDFVYRPRQQS